MKCVLLLLVGTTMLCVSQSRAQSPIQADSLQLWLRSDVGVDKLNGTVSRWRDQSGKGNDVIQFDTARQPSYVENTLNHKPVLRFDGFNDKLGFTGSTPMSQFTLFMVVKNDSGGGPHNCHLINFGPYGGDWSQWFFVLYGGLDRVSNLIAMGEGPNGGMGAYAPNISADGQWMVISIVYQSIYNESLRSNGVKATMAPIFGSGQSFFGPMGDPSGSGGGIAGGDGEPFGNHLTAKSDFAEVMVYNTVLTELQQLAIEQYLNSKYNIITGKIRVSLSSVDFGNLAIATSDTMTLRVDNVGGNTLNLRSISNGHTEYRLSNLPSFPLAIQPGDFLQLKVSFQPVAQGVVNDTLNLGSDDPLHPVIKISLRGKGVGAISAARAGVLYTSSVGTPTGYLSSMSTVSRTVDFIGPLGIPEIRGMSIRHADGIIYGASSTLRSTEVYRIDASSGEAVLLGRFPIGNLSALAFSPGDTLYGATTAGSLYRLDLATGHSDSIGTSEGLKYSGLSFHPRTGELWAAVLEPLGSILTLNTKNGAAAVVGNTGIEALTSSITFDPSGTLYGLIDNGSGEDYLATIDAVTALGAVIAGPLTMSNLRAITMRPDILLTTVKGRNPNDVPLHFALSQNYPNPFNPATTVSFSLPSSIFVSLKVFDALGREIAILASEEMSAGSHTMRWDAGKVASGIYYFRLLAGPFTETRKAVLLK